MSDLTKLSLNTATTKKLTIAEAASAASAAGLGGIGLWRDRVQEVGTKQALQITKDYGLEVTSLCRGGFLTATDPAEAQKALEDNRLAIEEAASVGTKELIFVVGGLPACPSPGASALPYPADAPVDPNRDLDGARKRLSDTLALLAPFAKENGVRIVLEPLHPIFAADRAIISTLKQALDLAAPFDPDVVGVVVDTYHVWWDPDLQAQIERAGRERRIASYQVCDWILPLASDPLLSRGHVGDGYIDFAAITKWVSDAGYRGAVEVEIFNQEIWDTPAAQTLETMSNRYLRFIAPYMNKA